MTQVRIAVSAEGTEGALIPARGRYDRVTFMPSRRRVTTGDAPEIVLPSEVVVDLAAANPVTVDLSPSDGTTWYWSVVEKVARADGSKTAAYAITIPDTADVLELAEIAHINTELFEPIADYPTIAEELDALGAAKANVSHTHAIGNVTGLQGALDAKATTTALADEVSAREDLEASLPGAFLGLAGNGGVAQALSVVPKMRKATADYAISWKDASDSSQGAWDLLVSHTTGYGMHIQTRSPGAAPGMAIALGLDNAAPDGGLGIGGILIANKDNAQGIIVHNHDTIRAGATGSYGLLCVQESAVAPVASFQQWAPSVAPALEVKTANHTPAAGQKLARFITGTANHLSGDIDASSGELRWIDKASLRDTQVNTTLSVKNDTGSGAPAQVSITDPAANAIIIEASANTDNKSNGSIRFYRAAGGSTYWASRIAAVSQGLAIQASGAAAKGSETWTNVVEVRNAAIGFFGSPPVSKPSITGSRGGNAALASLITALASLGLLSNATTA